MSNSPIYRPEHPYRNTPLGEVRAEVRNILNKGWKHVGNYRIARNTYNELRGTWIECNEWRVQEPKTLVEVFSEEAS